MLSGLIFMTPAYASTFTPSAVCSNSPETTLNWHADNASTTDQAFSWERLTGLETGSNTAPASSGVDFTTGSSGTSTPDTLRFTFDDGTGTATVDIAADVTPCVPAPTPVVAPAPVVEPTGFAIGGHASHAQMQEILSPSDYLIYLAHYNENRNGGVQADAATPEMGIMLQIIDLLKQEIALLSSQQ